MPSSGTITAFYTFVANTKALASEVNANFSNLRGHLIPTNTDTQTASDLTHDLGSDEHRWRTVYSNALDLETSTNTASLVIKGDTSKTAGAFLFQVESVTVAQILDDGFDGSNISTTSPINTTTAFASGVLPALLVGDFQANGTFTATSTDPLIIECIGGGGGAGGGGSGGSTGPGGGGGGGGGASLVWFSYRPSIGDVLSVTVAGQASGGVAGTGGGSGSAGTDGGASYVDVSGARKAQGRGGFGGTGGVGNTASGGGGGAGAGSQLGTSAGGGGAVANDGGDGADSGGIGGGGSGASGPSGGGGGGGGASLLASGKDGGPGGSSGNTGTGGLSASTSEYGAGAGGGGGGGIGAGLASGGNGGNGGPGRVRIFRVSSNT